MPLSPTATELRLAISSEAEALFFRFWCGGLYAVACRRRLLGEASSDSFSEGLERCRGDDSPQVGQALNRIRRLIWLNRRTPIRGHGAA